LNVYIRIYIEEEGIRDNRRDSKWIYSTRAQMPVIVYFIRTVLSCEFATYNPLLPQPWIIHVEHGPNICLRRDLWSINRSFFFCHVQFGAARTIVSLIGKRRCSANPRSISMWQEF